MRLATEKIDHILTLAREALPAEGILAEQLAKQLSDLSAPQASASAFDSAADKIFKQFFASNDDPFAQLYGGEKAFGGASSRQPSSCGSPTR